MFYLSFTRYIAVPLKPGILGTALACGEGKRIWVGACSWWVGSFILNSDVVASDEDRTGYNW